MLTPIIKIVRYRFFLVAGICPYLLGQVIGFHATGCLNWHYFWLGFFGIFLALVGVELFNEYFDAKEGGDRIFSHEISVIPDYFYLLGLCVFILAFCIGLYLAFYLGWPILLFSFLGFLGAYFYVGPPLRWAYRGLGEIVIALCYGPFMVFGSYYLQARRVDGTPLMASLVCGLSIFSLALLNEIPDYIQDTLVGKKNLVVRLGREYALKVFALSVWCTFILLGLGIWWKTIPSLAGITFLLLPLVINSIKTARENLEMPLLFRPAIKRAIITYCLVAAALGIGYIGGS